MHQPIREYLEEYLSGSAGSMSRLQVESHLGACAACRRELELMQWQAELLRTLRPPAEVTPPPGFYQRVMDRIQAQKQVSVWSAFVDPVFARRLAYVSLTLLGLFGALLAGSARRSSFEAMGPEMMLAEEAPAPPFGVDQERDRNVVLVTLATYEH